MVRAINGVRQAHGLPRLRPADSLFDSAARYARRMMRTDWRLRPRRTVDEWMASPEHRAILLSRRFTRIGAGHACGRYRRLRATMWVAHVARP